TSSSAVCGPDWEALPVPHRVGTEQTRPEQQKQRGRGPVNAANVWAEAADRIAAEARRLDDIAEDVRRQVRDLHWTGHNAEYFRRHAAYQAVRAGQNRDVVESLRVLMIPAAAAA